MNSVEGSTLFKREFAVDYLIEIYTLEDRNGGGSGCRRTGSVVCGSLRCRRHEYETKFSFLQVLQLWSPSSAVILLLYQVRRAFADGGRTRQQ